VDVYERFFLLLINPWIRVRVSEPQGIRISGYLEDDKLQISNKAQIFVINKNKEEP